MRLSWWIAAVFAMAAMSSAPGAETRSAARSIAIPVNAVGAGNTRVASDCIVPAGPPVTVTALAFHPDSQTLASAGYHEVLLWDLRQARLTKRVGPLPGRIRGLAFHPNGNLLAVAEGAPGSGGAVRLIDTGSLQPGAPLFEAKDEMFAVAFSPDGRWLAAGGADAQVRVWSVEDRKLVSTFGGRSGWVTGVAFSPGGAFFASSSADRTTEIRETSKWEIVSTVPRPLTDPARAVAFSPDNEWLAIAVGGIDERAVRFWRTASVKESTPAPGSSVRPRDTTRVTRPADVGPGMPLALAWIPAVTGERPRPARVFAAGTGNSIRVLTAAGGFVANLTGHQDWIYSLAATRDGTRLASGSGDGTVKIWNTADNTLLATLIQTKPQADEWVIVTPRGLFTATPAAAESLQWKMTNPNVTPAELAVRLQDPGAVRSILNAGRQGSR